MAKKFGAQHARNGYAALGKHRARPRTRVAAPAHKPVGKKG